MKKATVSASRGVAKAASAASKAKQASTSRALVTKAARRLPDAEGRA